MKKALSIIVAMVIVISVIGCAKQGEVPVTVVTPDVTVTVNAQ